MKISCQQKILVCLLICLAVFSQSSVTKAQMMGSNAWSGRRVIWTWIGGSSTSGANAGTYGTLGTPSTSNIPAARGYGCSVVDPSGNFWLFGGYVYGGSDASARYMNDLWKFDPATKNWTWTSGSSTSGSAGSYGAPYMPSARRDSACWSDPSGDFWMFGGATASASFSNELWKFDHTTLIWTMLSGTATPNSAGTYGILGSAAVGNVPPSRRRAAAWQGTSSTLWLFGGETSSGNYKNDVWKYDITSGFWTWMAGPQGVNVSSSFGTTGVAAATNLPPARRVMPYSVVDSSGNFWLFGGEGTSGTFSDLWNYDPTISQWTFVGGSISANDTGTYGTLIVPNPAYKPKTRTNSLVVIGKQENIYIFGGYNAVSGSNELNDFWSYSILSKTWAWLNGSFGSNASGVYGIANSPSVMNVPGGRDGMSWWVDSKGDVWMFGGATNAPFNDLWKANVN